MRLLIIPGLYPQTAADPSGIFIRDQARVLAKQHDVTVLVPRLLTPRTLLRWRDRANGTSPGNSANGSLREITVPIFNVSNRLETVTHWRWRRAMFHRALAELRADIVHAHFVRPAGAVAQRLREMWKTPAVLTEHSGPFSVHLQTARARRETLAALSGVDRVIAVSPFLAGEMQAAAPNVEPAIVGNVVDDEFFSPGPAEKPRGDGVFRLLFVGSLTWHKGLEYLLQACTKLKENHVTGWELIIVGDGPERQNLQQRATELGLGRQIIFAGVQRREEVRAWMRSSQVLVQPSVIETFCVVLIEAAASGIPVIATDCGGPSWIVRPDIGRLVPPRDPSALTAAMAEAVLGRLPSDAAVIRRAIVARFGRDAWLEDINRVYHAVLNR